ncbi:MAG: 5-(carboxyamino)imidazole ribonucleotide synthase [Pseudomonadota bacterium]
MSAHLKALPQNAAIGILGGGQLGRMLAISAASLGYKTIALDPDPEAPARQVCNEHICARYDDQSALTTLANRCAAVTYEFENVPVETARTLAEATKLFPPAKALEIAQDRLIEKNFLTSLGLAVAPFHAVDTAIDLRAALDDFGDGVLKTRRFGYDGKGQAVISADTCHDPAAILQNTGQGPYVLEALIPFNFEFSIIGARGQSGEIALYDPARNVHENGILRRSTVPAGLSSTLEEKARAAVAKLLDGLAYVGVLGVEFFAVADNETPLINEFAPRVHNSGHWTDTACITSQFEQHMRAVCGLPLGATKTLAPCEMHNLLGDEIDTLPAILENGGAHAVSYGKMEARAGRKMGHFTVLK